MNMKSPLLINKLIVSAMQTKLLDKICDDFFYREDNQKKIAYLSTLSDKNSQKLYAEIQLINEFIDNIQLSIGNQYYRHALVEITCLQKFCSKISEKLQKVIAKH
ncbi:hypothetical protein [Psychromonas sp. Urea-02u-13]|uniref:hypothetical protein n=1 Tax=Psychromonas sp. Urea-02u-13 TaxID=2058326 RepID=UPI000C34A722|nr:hypothetical protein [Psychromonas sp. Urea-02u-13]PKG38328.1 hypothetical protein CXF74_14155 [Psychromonas sp. Urea-02u-13]